ncbi:hypothetical protein CEUSTIGMA_g12012.t1 [Chlamydomonas eustigma]|uniref:Uncharacterized protein n=1 Tax=Chlamydomonas eustigma TaxID=1157962 RepID=A0A250XNC8_9CHLO|nr:hypothetical protein CEUSTIGMA_g12012.t1 [Chlamydomonas eustigma]|eukprot:GAX84591.1 hypothetical protein CEUSTIGMA_g12012.t1 [Chlamydomonas eustigma]
MCNHGSPLSPDIELHKRMFARLKESYFSSSHVSIENTSAERSAPSYAHVILGLKLRKAALDESQMDAEAQIAGERDKIRALGNARSLAALLDIQESVQSLYMPRPGKTRSDPSSIASKQGGGTVDDVVGPSSTVTSVVRSFLRKGFQKPKQEPNASTSFPGLSFFSSRKSSKNYTPPVETAPSPRENSIKFIKLQKATSKLWVPAGQMADNSLSVLVDLGDDDLWLQNANKTSTKHAVKEKQIGPTSPKVWTIRAADNGEDTNKVVVIDPTSGEGWVGCNKSFVKKLSDQDGGQSQSLFPRLVDVRSERHNSQLNSLRGEKASDLSGSESPVLKLPRIR